jgi:hypothetical protein
VTVGQKGKTRGNARKDFPLSLIEGQDNIKTAMLLTAINPEVGGVIIGGEHGVGKTIMARGAWGRPRELQADGAFCEDCSWLTR